MSEYPKIQSFDLVGPEGSSLVGSPIASATTIAPDHGIHHVTGTTQINTITIPWSGFSGTIFLVADGLWSLGTSGNIATAETISAVNQVVALTYDPTNAKWYVTATGASASELLPIVVDNSGSGNGVITARKTPSGSSATSNFLNVTGTSPTTPTANFVGVNIQVTGAGNQSFQQKAFQANLNAGYTGSSGTFAFTVSNASAGTGTNPIIGSAANFGNAAFASGTTTGVNVGNAGQGSNGDTSIGLLGWALTAKNNGINIGTLGLAANTGSTPTIVGGYFGVPPGSALPTIGVSSALIADNASTAIPLIVARDNGAALPTTGATATFTVLDGAIPQSGLTVLTSGTMTAERQGALTGSSIHSFTWTNAMVVALGASLTGDITICTLPAKTVVKNVYVVITGTAAGVATLTVAVGRVAAGYIDYIVASDAKVAANTVYGDASGERGTNLTGYDLPSYTGTTDVKAHFISTVQNLDQTTGSTGRVIIETALVP